jgi:two-component system, NarL family, nitrate/nitrite response regulator NarL
MIRIAVIDDHPLLREGVMHTFKREADMDVVGSGSSAQDAINLAMEFSPDVIVLDMNMPGDGITAVEAIAAVRPGTRTLMLTVVADEQKVCEAMQKGASGYILKGVGGAELVHTVRCVYNGESYVSPSLAAKLLSGARPELAKAIKVERNRFSDLTGREEQILTHVARGLSNKEIGNTLGLSEKTIKHYLTNVLQKLHVRNRVEAALLATSHASLGGTDATQPVPSSHIGA